MLGMFAQLSAVSKAEVPVQFCEKLPFLRMCAVVDMKKAPGQARNGKRARAYGPAKLRLEFEKPRVPDSSGISVGWPRDNWESTSRFLLSTESLSDKAGPGPR